MKSGKGMMGKEERSRRRRSRGREYRSGKKVIGWLMNFC